MDKVKASLLKVTYTYEKTDPTKTVYQYGEPLNLDGFSIVKKGSDGSSVTLVRGTDYTLDTSSFNSLTAGNYYLPYTQINGNDFSGSIILTVNARVLSDFSGEKAEGFNKTYFSGIQGSPVITMPTGVSGVTVNYRVKPYGAEDSQYGEWTTVKPIYTAVCDVTAEVKFSLEGYNDSIISTRIHISEGLMTITAESSVNREYDGEAYVPEISGAPNGAVTVYGIGASEEYPLTEKPSFTDAGEYVLYYKISAANYQDYYGRMDIKINHSELNDGISAQGGYKIASAAGSSITVSGIKSGDTVEYSADGLVWAAENLTVYTAGTHTVYYRVTRGNSRTQGSATLILIKDVLLTDIVLTNTSFSYAENYNRTILFSGHNPSDRIMFRTEDGEWQSDEIFVTEPTAAPLKIYVQIYREGSSGGWYENYATVTINKADYDNKSISCSVQYKEGLKLSDIELTSGWRWANPNTALTAVGNNSYDAIYNADPIHYNDFEIKVSVNVYPADAPSVTVSDYEGVYDAKPHGIIINGGVPDGYTAYYSVNSEDYSTAPVEYTNAGSYLVYYKLEKENYASVTGYAKVKISKASYNDITYNDGNKITVTWVSGLFLNDIPLEDGFVWKNPVQYLTPDVYVQTALYNLDSDNYNDFEVQITVTVNPATITGVSVGDIELEYLKPVLPIVSGKLSGDTVLYSTAYPEYVWSENIFGSSPNVGVYTVYFKLARANHSDYIGSFKVTFTKAETTYTVSSVFTYDGTSKTASIISGAPVYTVTYSDTTEGTYTSTAPVCVMPGTYTFYIKLTADNYTFADNPRKITLVINKKSNSDLYGLYPDDISGDYGITVFFDRADFENKLTELGISDYTLYHRYSDTEEWSSGVLSFSELTPEGGLTIYLKLVSDLYEDYENSYWFYFNVYITARSIEDVNERFDYASSEYYGDLSKSQAEEAIAYLLFNPADLPTDTDATYWGDSYTVSGIPCYKVTITGSALTMQDYIDSLSACFKGSDGWVFNGTDTFTRTNSENVLFKVKLTSVANGFALTLSAETAP